MYLALILIIKSVNSAYQRFGYSQQVMYQGNNLEYD